MTKMYHTLRDHPDPLLLLCALLTAFLACLAFFLLLDRGRGIARGVRAAWLVLAAWVAGAGLWAAHALSGLPGGRHPGPALLPVLVPILGALLAAWLAAAGGPGRRAAGGVLFGLGLVAAQALGPAAPDGPAGWAAALRLAPGLLAAPLLAVGASALAFAWRGGAGGRAAILTLGVALLPLAAPGAAGGSAGGLEGGLAVAALPWPEQVRAVLPMLGTVLGPTLVIPLGALAMAVLRSRRILAEARLDGAGLRALADAAFEGIAICDARHRLVAANEAMAELLGRSHDALPGLSLDGVLRDRGGRGVGALLAAAATEPVRAILDTAEGEVPVELRSRRLATALGSRTVAALRDLRERLASEARIRHLADHDPLTGLGNRALLEDRVSLAAARSRRSGEAFALLCLGIDRFKAVNDSLGHAAGDRLIRQMAERLRAELRETDFVARMGGDEFLVLQSDVERPEAAAQLALRLCARLAEPYELGDGQAGALPGTLPGSVSVSVTVSIGIALCPEHAAEAQPLRQNAEAALARAKREGRGRHAFFSHQRDGETRLAQSLEGDLRLALGRSQLALLYQPQVVTATGALAGFEALLRWHHPTHGLVPPDVFIPIAEETGAILPIGAWVLRAACAEAAGWSEPLRISVNASPEQLQRPGFAGAIAAALQQTGLDPRRLEIEVTESMLIRDAGEALTTLEAIRALGVQVAMDDFGTGYSSLHTLRTFPFSRLKVDRSFVRDLATGPQAGAIVRAVLGLGRSLGMPVVAEGVETPEQLALLKSEGCEEVQGYLLGRPMTAEAARQMIRGRDVAVHHPAEAGFLRVVPR